MKQINSVSVNGTTTNTPASYFPSAAALRAAHNELIAREEASKSSLEFYLEVESFIKRGRSTGALLDSDSDRVASQSILNYWKSALFATGREPTNATLAKFDPALLPDTTKDTQSPYVGLNAFQETDRALFFGRETSVEAMVGGLKAKRLLALTGPSGSGKSSLILAGLLPALKAGGLSGSEKWRYFEPMVPGSDPLGNLLKTIGSLQEDAAILGERILEDSSTLLQLLNETGPSPTVLVIDQFEELFTLVSDDHESERIAFSSNLVHLFSAPNVEHRVILTMRTDKRGQLAKLPDLRSLFLGAQVEVDALDAAELREVIVKPAEQVGLRFQPGIVEALLKEIIGETAGLPLLQFALLKLWNTRQRNWVTWEAYQRLGGVRKALGRSADEFYDGLLPDQQQAAKRIFLRLVRAGGNLEGDRARVLRGSLLTLGNQDIVARVLQKLAEASLIRVIPASKGKGSVEDQLEVAHEALIRNWEKLASWLQEEQISLRQREQITRFAENWYTNGRKPEDLLRGSILFDALAYTDRYKDDLNQREKDFVEESVQDVERTARKMRWTIFGLKLACGIIGVLLVGCLVLWQRSEYSYRQSEYNYRQSHSHELAYAAQNHVNEPPLRILLALDAVYTTFSKYGTTTPQALAALDVAIQETGSRLSVNERPSGNRRLVGEEDTDLIAVKISPDWTHAATVSPNATASVWEAVRKEATKGANPLGPVDIAKFQYSQVITPASTPGDCIDSGPDAPTAKHALRDNSSTLEMGFVEATSMRQAWMLASQADPAVNGLAFSQNGRFLASFGSGGGQDLIVWDIIAGCKLKTISGEIGTISAVAFSDSQDHSLIIGSKDGRIATIDTISWAKRLMKEVDKGPIAGLAFSSDSRHFALANLDGSGAIWDLKAERKVPIKGSKSTAVVGVAYTSDGKKVAIASVDQSVGYDPPEAHVRFWDPVSGELIGDLPLHQHGFIGFAISEGGTRIATAALDNTVKVWDIEKYKELFAFTTQDGAALDIALSRDGNKVLTAKADGIISVHFLDLHEAIKHGRMHVTRRFKPNECNDVVNDANCVEFPWATKPDGEVRH